MTPSGFPHGAGSGPYTWTWDASILIGIAAGMLVYFLATGPFRKRGGWAPASRRQQFAFTLGMLVLFFALVSPLDHLSDEYLLSAHMIQHLLLLMIVPPLWLIGLPEGLVDRVIAGRHTRQVARWLVHPVVAYLLFNGLVYSWHLPSFYQAALENENLHVVEHLSFLVVAAIGWWPAFGPSIDAAPRAAYPVQLIYLFLMMFPMTLLAALITFAKQPIYPFYADAPRVWGLSLMADQQVAGLIMWIPGNMVFFAAFANAFFGWFAHQEHLDNLLAAGPHPVSGRKKPEGSSPGNRPELLKM
ncbi:MAG: cytochrome c oxidase assembly protein [Anaerolineaceae bacterium]|nr:cytochrome c oxidase assembly protein [Anaerolineaceae bacterium]